jgi:hypothetical protein
MSAGLPPAFAFDPSANGVASGYSDAWTPFLGAPVVPYKQKPSKSINKYNMPDAYIGQNLTLRDTVEDLTFTAYQTWYTERALPAVRTDQIHLQWERQIANPAFMPLQPHQTAPRVVTSKSKMMTAELFRRGLGAEFELDFVKTPAGRSRFVGRVAQLARAWQETANVQTLYVLLTCDASTQQFARDYGIIKQGQLMDYLKRQANRFMILQKETYGAEILVNQIDTEQRTYGGSSNMIICDRSVVDYLNTQPERVEFWTGGQQAVDRLNDRSSLGGVARGGVMEPNNPQLTPVRLFKGKEVYMADSYYVDGIGQLDLLSRVVEIGVYNSMIDRTVDYSTYRTSNRDIIVYDNDADNWATIRFRDAILYNVLWNDRDGGDVIDPWGGRNRAAAPGGDNNDVRNDWVRYGSGAGEKQDVQLIGDLDAEHLSAVDCIHAAEAIAARLRVTTDVIGNLVAGLGGSEGQLERGYQTRQEGEPRRYFPTVSAEPLEVGVGAGLFDRLAGLLGSDNLFFGANVRSGASSANDFWRDFAQPSSYRATSTAGPPTSIGASATFNREPQIQRFLIEGVVAGFIPEEERGPALDVARNSSLSITERFSRLKQIFSELTHRGVVKVFSAANPEDHISEALDARREELEKALQQAAERDRPQTQEPVDREIRHFKIGTPLPTGYRYLNAQEEAKAAGPARGDCPTSLLHFNSLSHLFVGSGMGGSRGTAGQQSFIGSDSNTRSRGVEGGSDPAAAAQARGRRLSERFNNIDARIRAISLTSYDSYLKWLAIMWIGSRFTRDRMVHFCDNDVPVPIDPLLLRPHCAYRTRYLIQMKGGGEAGHFYFGHGDMMVGSETSHKVMLMYYTVYMQGVVENPQNVYVAENVFCHKYLGGMGAEFWESANDYLKNANDRSAKSIIAWAMPWRTKKPRPVIDARGKFYTEYRLQLVDQAFHLKWCFPGALRLAALLQWYDPKGKGSRGANRSAQREQRNMNFICWQGVQMDFSPLTKGLTDVTPEQGNMGNKVYPGCGEVRNGEAKYLRSPEYLTALNR